MPSETSLKLVQVSWENYFYQCVQQKKLRKIVNQRLHDVFFLRKFEYKRIKLERILNQMKNSTQIFLNFSENYPPANVYTHKTFPQNSGDAKNLSEQMHAGNSAAAKRLYIPM